MIAQNVFSSRSSTEIFPHKIDKRKLEKISWGLLISSAIISLWENHDEKHNESSQKIFFMIFENWKILLKFSKFSRRVKIAWNIYQRFVNLQCSVEHEKLRCYLLIMINVCANLWIINKFIQS